jgi:phage terminase small subunit
MLTGKQEKFVRNLIKGMTQREAYKNSYDAENMSDKCIDEEACKLFNSPKVSQRYQELQERLANAYIMSAQERLEYLTDIVTGIEQEKIIVIEGGEQKEVERPANLNERMKAIDIMNKMQGEYVTKVDANVNTDVNIVVELVD